MYYSLSSVFTCNSSETLVAEESENEEKTFDEYLQPTFDAFLSCITILDNKTRGKEKSDTTEYAENRC